MPKVFVITGPSGVGKGTLIGELLEQVSGLELSVSATTREPRHGEVDCRDYHFLDRDEFDRRAREGEFLEHATYSGNRYGTLRSEVERRLAGGSRSSWRSRSRGLARCGPRCRRRCRCSSRRQTRGRLRERLEGRGTDSVDDIGERLRTAELELAAQEEFPHVVVNDRIERAAAELERIVRNELGATPKLVQQ